MRGRSGFGWIEINMERSELRTLLKCLGVRYAMAVPLALVSWFLLPFDENVAAVREAVKLAREGLLWAAYGKAGQCGPYFEPIPRKDVWRTQLVHPTVTASGTCCRPLGAPTAVWGAGKTYPVNGEDGAILLWRKRDCCASKNFF